MVLTDTHIHLYLEEFDSNRETLIKDAIAHNVSRFFLPNIDLNSIERTINLAKAYPENCFAMMGLHPCYVNENYVQDLKQIEKVIADGTVKYYAIGEIGLDYYWDLKHVEEQKKAFIHQLHLASELSLPVSLHTRNATRETIDILQQYSHLNVRGIFHCYSGTVDDIKAISDMGFYFGIGGVVTFKKAGLDKEVELIDLEQIVLETDAPYLAPAPHRGKQNCPVYLRLVAEKIAEIKHVHVKDIARITTENSQKIFGI